MAKMEVGSENSAIFNALGDGKYVCEAMTCVLSIFGVLLVIGV